MAVKSRRYGMASAQIPVFLTQKPSTQNGINRATTLFLAYVKSVSSDVGNALVLHREYKRDKVSRPPYYDAYSCIVGRRRSITGFLSPRTSTGGHATPEALSPVNQPLRRSVSRNRELIHLYPVIALLSPIASNKANPTTGLQQTDASLECDLCDVLKQRWW